MKIVDVEGLEELIQQGRQYQAAEQRLADAERHGNEYERDAALTDIASLEEDYERLRGVFSAIDREIEKAESTGESGSMAVNLMRKGLLLTRLDRASEAIELFDRALERLDRSRHADVWLEVSVRRALTLGQLGRLAEAEESLDELLADVSGDEVAARIRLLGHKGDLYLTSGQDGRAENAFKRALQLGGADLQASESARLRRGAARALIGQGELEQAAFTLAQGLDEAESADDVELQRTIVGDLIAVQYSLGNLERVLALSKEARRLAEARGDHIEAAMQREIAIKVLLHLKRHEKALVLLHESLDYVRRRGPRRKMLVLMMELGKVNFDLGRLEESEAAYQEALEEAQEQSNPRAMAVVLGRLGALYAERGEFEAALRYGELALDKVDAETAPDVVAEQHVLLALTYRDLGQVESAVAAAEKASELYENLESDEMALGARQLLEELTAAV